MKDTEDSRLRVINTLTTKADRHGLEYTVKKIPDEIT